MAVIKEFKEVKEEIKAYVEETKAENQASIENLQDDDDDPNYEENNSTQDLDYGIKDDFKPHDENGDDDNNDITYEGNTCNENVSLNDK
jgi:hypothetical protein